MKIDVGGLEEVLRGFDELREKGERAAKRGIKKGAAVVRDEAKRLAPVYNGPPVEGVVPGKLRDAIEAGGVKGKGTYASVEVGVWGDKAGFGEDGFYARFMEFGTDEHDIAITKGPFAGVTVHHPGNAAHPFLVPALENKIDEVIGILEQELKEAIEENV